MKPSLRLLGAACLGNLGIASLWPNLGCSLAATALFFVTAIVVFRRDPAGVWLLFPFVLTQLSVLVSLNAIDAGAYMIEMGQYGRPSAAAAGYACYAFVFVITCIWAFRRTARHTATATPAPAVSPGMHPLLQWGLVLASLGCVAYLAMAGLHTGFPLLTGTDRFAFRRLYADVVTVNILNLKIVPSCALGMVAAQSGRRALRRCAYAAFVGLMGASFLYGDKFFIILESIGAFMLPFIIRDPRSAARMLRRALPLVAPGIVAVLGVTCFIYSDHGARSAGATVALLGERIAGQGELWEMAVQHSPGWVRFDTDLVRQNLASLVARVPQDYAFEHHLGAEYFVYRFSPPAMYRSFQHNAGFVTPTMGYEAYGLVIFGFAGLLAVMVLTGICVGQLMRWLNRVIERGNLFSVLLPVVVMSETGKLLAQGTLYNVLSVSTLKIYAAFLVLQMLVAGLARGLSPGEHHAGESSVAAFVSRVSPPTSA